MTRASRHLFAGLLLIPFLFAACADRAPDRLVLDGRPRVPDAEGVVETVSRTRIVLDGDRKYRVDRDLQSFSTQTMQAVPILQRKGQYVHIGVDGGRVRWVAAVGDVVPGAPSVVYFTGQVRSHDGSKVTFRDGTVLTLGSNVEAPTSGFVVATIDPHRHVVTSMSTP